MNKLTAFERDFDCVKYSFPKLDHSWNSDKKFWLVKGELDICDVKGNYWDTFNIAILVSETYPYCVPHVFEISEIIPREEDWHVSADGECCVDIDNKLIAASRIGIDINKFITDLVYPFFANQLFKLAAKRYAGEEYGHRVDGLIQYYLEDLKFPSVEKILNILESILSGADLTRNTLCPCGSEIKTKQCHEKEIEIIKSLGRTKIEKDASEIGKWLLAQKN